MLDGDWSSDVCSSDLRAPAAPTSTSTAASSAAAAAPQSWQTRGVVTELDAESVTLEHEPVPALKWPGMTMPFKLAKPELAKALKVGQQVTFSFIKQGDDWAITEVQPAAAEHQHGAKP
jgi:Cu(I)/Ag(I) efflux system membrane fusion protein